MSQKKRKSDVRKLYRYLKRFHKECVGVAAPLESKPGDSYSFRFLQLYLSLLDLTGCVLAIFEHQSGRGHIGIPIVLRTMLETSASLHAMVNRLGYEFQLEFDDTQSWLNYLNKAHKGSNNPVLAKTAEHPEIPDMYEELKLRLKCLKLLGFKRRNMEHKFKTAGMKNEYQTIYHQFSLETHSNLTALTQRHLKPGDGWQKPLLSKPLSDDRAHFLLGCTADWLVFSTETFFRKMNIPDGIRIAQNFLQQLGQLRDECTARDDEQENELRRDDNSR